MKMKRTSLTTRTMIAAKIAALTDPRDHHLHHRQGEKVTTDRVVLTQTQTYRTVDRAIAQLKISLGSSRTRGQKKRLHPRHCRVVRRCFIRPCLLRIINYKC
ncbi:MAG: hypothetical protein WCS37_22805 [Chloroflexota bacterium]